MTKVIPFKAEHVECMNIRKYERETVYNMPDFQKALKDWENRNTTGTIIHDGRILAIFGFFELWPGVCEVFMLPSEYLAKYPAAFARCVKRTIESGAFNSFHRVQLRAIDDKLHNRFNTFLGFEKEGVLKKYDSQGNDFIMWARVK